MIDLFHRCLNYSGFGVREYPGWSGNSTDPDHIHDLVYHPDLRVWTALTVLELCILQSVDLVVYILLELTAVCN